MRVILTMACALAFSASAFAAPSTSTPPPAPPAQTIQKADQKPLRLREPLLLDDRRHQLAPPGRLPGSNKPMPKDGGGPEIG